jgi:hypothetical protein
MRQTIIVAAITAAVSIWGTSMIIAHSAKTAGVSKASSSIDVMQMMRDAKNLPEEKFDAN